MSRESTTLKTGDPAPAFRLPSIDRREVALRDLLAGRKALVLMFLRGTW